MSARIRSLSLHGSSLARHMFLAWSFGLNFGVGPPLNEKVDVCGEWSYREAIRRFARLWCGGSCVAFSGASCVWFLRGQASGFGFGGPGWSRWDWICFWPHSICCVCLLHCCVAPTPGRGLCFLLELGFPFAEFVLHGPALVTLRDVWAWILFCPSFVLPFAIVVRL